MTNTLQTLRRAPRAIGHLATRFGYNHPYLAFAALFFAIPIGMLLALGVSTTAVLLPISLLLGWI